MRAMIGTMIIAKRIKLAKPSEMSASDFMTLTLTSSSDFHRTAYSLKSLRP